MRTNNFLAIPATLMILLGACNNPKNAATSSDTAAATTETAPASPGIDITGKKWKLIELAGQPVGDSINGKEPFIMFSLADSSYSANGGCNGLGGKFELDQATLRIQFTQGMSTMMACADMSVEEGLKNVFTNADNYTVNDTILSLNKARMAPLVRFRVAQ